MKKIIINQDLCIGCNTCASLNPKIFQLDSTTFKAKVIEQPAEITPEIEAIVNSCPVGAISIVEE